jgi:hypothetical protein
MEFDFGNGGIMPVATLFVSLLEVEGLARFRSKKNVRKTDARNSASRLDLMQEYW